ncbi:transposase [Streptomyces lateritius]|uniref:Transposase n=1 Tax=Streptomyces lateritius TaxID=67313 RepID=A0ABW6YI88_9ACTN
MTLPLGLVPGDFRRGDLSDEVWARLDPYLPVKRGRGGRRRRHRRVGQRDSVPAADRLPCRDLPSRFGSWKTVHDRHRRGRRTARGKGLCGLSRPMPMPRAGSTGAWPASIPRLAALISTRPAPPLVPRSLRVGEGVQRVTVLMRPRDAREPGSPAKFTSPGKAGAPARVCDHARPVGRRATDDSRAGRDPRAPAGWRTPAHPAGPCRGATRRTRHAATGVICADASVFHGTVTVASIRLWFRPA